MRSSSLDFALQAILRMSQSTPGELVIAPPQKSTQKKGSPEELVVKPLDLNKAATQPCPALLAISGARRTRRICRACGLQSQLDKAARSIPEWLRCSAAPTGFQWQKLQVGDDFTPEWQGMDK